MKFFTPELFVELNSDDDKVVDRAEEKWLKALRQYRQHLKRIGDKLLTSLQRFSEEYCLHDASVLPPSDRSEAFLPLLVWRPQHSKSESTGAIIPVRSEGSLLLLWYLDTTKRPVLEKPVDSPVFYTDDVIWLYDEISSVTGGRFAHEILFSNGIVARIVFRDFLLVEQPDFRISTSTEPRDKSKIRSKVG